MRFGGMSSKPTPPPGQSTVHTSIITYKHIDLITYKHTSVHYLRHRTIITNCASCLILGRYAVLIWPYFALSALLLPFLALEYKKVTDRALGAKFVQEELLARLGKEKQ